MKGVLTQTSAPAEVASTLLSRLNQGQIEEALFLFAEDFTYADHGIGVEFTDATRLADYFRKARTLYPDYSLQINRTFVSGDHVITEWTLHVTVTEPFYAGLSRRDPVTLGGVSIARIDEGRIVDWADYYDGLSSRRSALAAHAREWVEY